MARPERDPAERESLSFFGIRFDPGVLFRGPHLPPRAALRAFLMAERSPLWTLLPRAWSKRFSRRTDLPCGEAAGLSLRLSKHLRFMRDGCLDQVGPDAFDLIRIEVALLGTLADVGNDLSHAVGRSRG